MPEVVEAAGGGVEVLMDGGIRRGSDVLVALALGARAVLVGRPVVWGLALAGADGVAHVLDGLAAELADDLLLAGRGTVGDVDASLVRRPAAGPWAGASGFRAAPP